MWGGFDLSSIVEAGTKLKEEVESNISSWDQAGQRVNDGSIQAPEHTEASAFAAGAHDASPPGNLHDQKRRRCRIVLTYVIL
jgi:hypothetical protein